jgi:hypothetical protein
VAVDEVKLILWYWGLKHSLPPNTTFYLYFT